MIGTIIGRLKASMPASVVRYFDANWHPCRQEWVLCWQRENVTFGERTNNRLESVNRRLKAVVRSGSSLPQFFKDLTAAIGCMRHERVQALLTATDKVCVRPYSADSVQAQFSSALTSFATRLVLQQLQLAEANQPQLPLTVAHNACFCSYAATVGKPFFTPVSVWYLKCCL